MRHIQDWQSFITDPVVVAVLEELGVDGTILDAQDNNHWTLALLEDLKPKAQDISTTPLKWVLSTAMPLKTDFRVFLNREQIASSKENYESVIDFKLSDLPIERLASLSKLTKETWRKDATGLYADSFPSGITGEVTVTKRSLYGGKSDDISRSHGFFVFVRDRLINDNDPLFGLDPLYYGVFNRFVAEITADDLDAELKASRETIENSSIRNAFRYLLREIFNEANSRYERATSEPSKKGKKEGEVVSVPQYLVNQPVADVIAADTEQTVGTEADNSWFYLKRLNIAEIPGLVQKFYNDKPKFRFDYINGDKSDRMVEFNPVTVTFVLNQNHELVREYVGEAAAKTLLEDFVTAEVLLEIYLRESQIDPTVIGDVLQKRDSLLRNLVKDHIYSPAMAAKTLREAYANEFDLEVAVVVAARILGFVANHVSLAGEPDGIARFTDYPGGSKTITLEAKSSTGTPSLGNLDLAGVYEHMVDKNADGCLLVAPSYPGETRGAGSAVAVRAGLFSEETKKGISCWTIDQLARFVEAAESRHLNARDALGIILTKFAPDDVQSALDQMLNTERRDNPALYLAVLRALRGLEKRLMQRARTIDIVATEVTREEAFEDTPYDDIEEAIRAMEKASQGGMTINTANEIRIHLSLDQLANRLSDLTKVVGKPQTLSGFREYDDA